MEYKINHIPKNTQNNRRPALFMEPTTITIHNTANPTSTALNERNWLVNSYNKVTASYHIAVDEKEAIECIPLNEVAWHAGDGSGANSGNKTSIGIEICESGNYSKTLDNAVELIAKMLKERNWGIDKLRRHYDWSGKNCPRLMSNNNWSEWADFKKRVGEKMAINTNNSNIVDIVDVEGVKIIKERIYASGGKLFYTKRSSGIKATDVRRFSLDPDKYYLKPVYAKNKKVSELVKEHGAILGFNAPFWYQGNIIGMFHDGNKLHFSAYDKALKWHQVSLVDGKYIIEKHNPLRKDQTWQGAPLLVENSKACWDKYNKDQNVATDIGRDIKGNLVRAQRTFMWLDSKGFINIGISDGRVPGIDEGLTIEEESLYAISNDAEISINFDGGGSTILASKNGGLNQSQNRGINERINHHAILVFKKEPKKEESPAPIIDTRETIKVTKTKIDLIDTKANKKTETEGFLLDGSTYIKMREVAEYLGFQVAWDDDIKKPGLIK